MVLLKEIFNQDKNIKEMLQFGSSKFKLNLEGDRIMHPHDLMEQATNYYLQIPFINSGINQLAMFISGGDVSIQADDKKTQEFWDTWLQDRPETKETILSSITTGLITGNLFTEVHYENKKNIMGNIEVVDGIKPINESYRVYYNLSRNLNKNNYWLYRVNELITSIVDDNGKKIPVSFYPMQYEKYIPIPQRMFRAIPMQQKYIKHLKFGWGKDGFYGSSFLFSVSDDIETLKSILKNMILIARYRAIGNKIITLGEKEQPALPQDVQDLKSDIGDLGEGEHLITNKKISVESLSNSGEYDSMSSEIDFLRRDSMSGLLPAYLTPWSDQGTTMGAGEARIPFEISLKIFNRKIINYYNDIIIKPIMKAYNLSGTATFKFAKVDLLPEDVKIRNGLDLLRDGVITKDYFRANYMGLKPSEIEKLNKEMPKDEGENQRFSYDAGFREQYLKENIIKQRKPLNHDITLHKIKNEYVIKDFEDVIQSFPEEKRKAAEDYFNFYVTNIEEEKNIYQEDDMKDEMNDTFSLIDKELKVTISKAKKSLDKHSYTEAKKIKTIVYEPIIEDVKTYLKTIEKSIIEKVKNKNKGSETFKKNQKIILDGIREQIKRIELEFSKKIRTLIMDSEITNESQGKVIEQILKEVRKIKPKLKTTAIYELKGRSNLIKLRKAYDNEIKRYIWRTTVDDKTCEVCLGRNGKVFNIKTALKSKNVNGRLHYNIPGIEHPNCRCNLELMNRK